MSDSTQKDEPNRWLSSKILQRPHEQRPTFALPGSEPSNVQKAENAYKDLMDEFQHTPIYLISDHLDSMSQEEVKILKDNFFDAQNSPEYKALNKNIALYPTDYDSDQVKTIITVRNFLAYDELTALLREIGQAGPGSQHQRFEKVLEKRGKKKEWVAKTLIYAQKSDSYQRLLKGEIPKSRADREIEDITKEQFEFLTKEVKEETGAIERTKSRKRLTKEREKRTHKENEEKESRQEQEIPTMGDFSYLTSIAIHIYEGYKIREDKEITKDDTLDLAARYTRLAQSDIYQRLLNSPNSPEFVYQELGVNGHQVLYGIELIREFLKTQVPELSNNDEIRQTVNNAFESGWYERFKSDTETEEGDPLLASRKARILEWFDILRRYYGPSAETAPRRLPKR